MASSSGVMASSSDATKAPRTLKESHAFARKLAMAWAWSISWQKVYKKKHLEIENERKKAYIYMPETMDPSRWLEEIPMVFSRSDRYDLTNNKEEALTVLFSKLPEIQQPDASEAYPTEDAVNEMRAYDTAFAKAIWPLANSEFAELDKYCKDGLTATIWNLSRASFALTFAQAEGFNGIKNRFMDGIATLISMLPKDNWGVKANGEVDYDKPLNKKTAWITHCHRIARGRQNHKEPFENIERRFVDPDVAKDLGYLTGEMFEDHRCAHCGVERKPAPEGQGWVKCDICWVRPYHHLSRVYCSSKCYDEDFPEHEKSCKRRGWFLRNVLLLSEFTSRFQKATFTGFLDTIEIIKDDPPVVLEDQIIIQHDGITLSNQFDNMGMWTGESVFPERAQRLLKDVEQKQGERMANIMVASDHYSYLYWYLRKMILSMFDTQCDHIEELEIYVSNAIQPTIIAGSSHREINRPLSFKGRNAMFHPHKVLVFHLSGASNDVFVVDLHACLFGWKNTVLPWSVFARSRYAGIVGRVNILGGGPNAHTSPRDMFGPPRLYGLYDARMEVVQTMENAVDKWLWTYRNARRTSTSYIVRDTNLGLFNTRKMKLLLAVDAAADKAAKHARKGVDEHGNALIRYRKYLALEADEYSHDFAMGVTSTRWQNQFFKPVWLTQAKWKAVVGDARISWGGPDDHLGADMEGITPIWTRLMQKSAEQHRNVGNAMTVIGPKLASILGIDTSGGFSRDESAKLWYPAKQWYDPAREKALQDRLDRLGAMPPPKPSNCPCCGQRIFHCLYDTGGASRPTHTHAHSQPHDHDHNQASEAAMAAEQSNKGKAAETGESSKTTETTKAEENDQGAQGADEEGDSKNGGDEKSGRQGAGKSAGKKNKNKKKKGKGKK